MARSLCSLAGFCMGEYGDFDPEIILLQLLLIIKIFPHRAPAICCIQVSALSQEARDF